MKAHPVGAEKPDGCKVYKSSSTAEYVTDAQYITEMIVERKARADKVTLTYKYWNDSKNKYAKYFRSQITQAHKLLNKYSVQAIIKALTKLQWCHSLFPAFFVKEVGVQQKILDNIDKAAKNQTIEISKEEKIGAKVITKRSKFALLKEASNNAKTNDTI